MLTLSIFNPLPSQKLRDASILHPPSPTADLWSPLWVSDGGDIRRILNAAIRYETKHHKQQKDAHSFPVTAHLYPSSLFAIAPPPAGVTRESRTQREGSRLFVSLGMSNGLMMALIVSCGPALFINQGLRRTGQNVRNMIRVPRLCWTDYCKIPIRTTLAEILQKGWDCPDIVWQLQFSSSISCCGNFLLDTHLHLTSRQQRLESLKINIFGQNAVFAKNRDQKVFRSAGWQSGQNQQNGVQTSMPLSGSCLCLRPSALLSRALIEVNPTLKLRCKFQLCWFDHITLRRRFQFGISFRILFIVRR